MERRTAFNPDDERETLRRLKDELFAQPPLEVFGDSQIRRRVAVLIERALRGAERRRPLDT
jgi:hypothetical protein